MAWRLTPSRRRGVEILDDSATPAEIRSLAMADLVRSNALFGGTRATVRALRTVLPHLGREATLLDVGTGLADIPDGARRAAARTGVRLAMLGLDVSEQVVHAARRRLDGVVVGDARRIPLADSSVDVVTCSQLLHHFECDDAHQVIAELHRVARRWVVIADLRRSWLAAGGFWIASIALRFHPVTRVDGVASVLRGFTDAELSAWVQRATGITPRIERGRFWRVCAVWEKPVLAR